MREVSCEFGLKISLPHSLGDGCSILHAGPSRLPVCCRAGQAGTGLFIVLVAHMWTQHHEAACHNLLSITSTSSNSCSPAQEGKSRRSLIGQRLAEDVAHPEGHPSQQHQERQQRYDDRHYRSRMARPARLLSGILGGIGFLHCRDTGFQVQVRREEGNR